MIYSNTGKLLFTDEYQSYFGKMAPTKVIQSRGSSKVSRKLKLQIDESFSEKTRKPGFCINSTDTALKVIRELESGFSIIEEGLISTYPTESLISHFKLKFKQVVDKSLIDSEFPARDEKIIDFCEMSDENQKVSPQVMFCVPAYNENDIKKLIRYFTDEFIKFGYYMSNYDVNKANGFCFAYIQFEAKYTNMLAQLEPILYHVTPKKYLNKILQQGLVPYSKSNDFEYQPRVYLFNKCPQDQVYEYGMYKAKLSNDNGFCIFKVFRDKLVNDQLFKGGKQRFYLDSAFSMTDDGTTDQTAVYTYGNIPLRLLSKYYVECNINSDVQLLTPIVKRI